MCQVPGAGTWHLDFQVPGALCQVTWKVGKWGIPEKGYQNTVQKCLFQVASALQSKVMAQTWLGQLRPIWPCILPCNLMKERYLSKTPFLTFVYLSNCNIKLTGNLGKSQKSDLFSCSDSSQFHWPTCFLSEAENLSSQRDSQINITTIWGWINIKHFGPWICCILRCIHFSETAILIWYWVDGKFESKQVLS